MDETNLATYEAIAKEFSETRAYVWKCVKDFTNTITSTKNASVLEIGCGNGKNMEYIQNHTSSNVVGIDYCSRFIDICNFKKLRAIHSNSSQLPFPDNFFDYILCIAMFHHLLTEKDKNACMNEILRVMKSGAHGILTCWSTLQPPNSRMTFTEGVNEVPWKGRKNINKMRYYYVYTQTMFQEYFESFQEIAIETIYNEAGNWILVFKKR